MHVASAASAIWNNATNAQRGTGCTALPSEVCQPALEPTQTVPYGVLNAQAGATIRI